MWQGNWKKEHGSCVWFENKGSRTPFSGSQVMKNVCVLRTKKPRYFELCKILKSPIKVFWFSETFGRLFEASKTKGTSQRPVVGYTFKDLQILKIKSKILSKPFVTLKIWNTQISLPVQKRWPTQLHR